MYKAGKGNKGEYHTILTINPTALFLQKKKKRERLNFRKSCMRSRSRPSPPLIPVPAPAPTSIPVAVLSLVKNNCSARFLSGGRNIWIYCYCHCMFFFFPAKFKVLEKKIFLDYLSIREQSCDSSISGSGGTFYQHSPLSLKEQTVF